MNSQGGWVVSKAKRKQKPRKKPAAQKRADVVVPIPSNVKLSDLQEAVYLFLANCYPRSMTCEDIMVGIRMDTKVEIEDVWKVMDNGPIVEIVNEPFSKNYVLKTLEEERKK